MPRTKRGVTTVGRLRRQTPPPPAPPTTAATSTRRVAARYPNHLWHADLTLVPTSAGFWASWLSFGRPVCKPHPGGPTAPIPKNLAAFCARVFSHADLDLPPAFVMDVGMIEDRGLAVVEFNPACCSGLAAADPNAVLAVLARACQDSRRLSAQDRHWVIAR